VFIQKIHGLKTKAWLIKKGVILTLGCAQQHVYSAVKFHNYVLVILGA